MKNQIVYLKHIEECITFTHEDGRKVWVIDTLPKSRLDSSALTQAEKAEHNYFTILLPEEY